MLESVKYAGGLPDFPGGYRQVDSKRYDGVQRAGERVVAYACADAESGRREFCVESFLRRSDG